MAYNVDVLNELPILEVIKSLGSDLSGNGKIVRCFNAKIHNNNDEKPSLAIYKNSNSCYCFACGVSGKPINIAKEMFGGDFKKACEFLHSHFNIPYDDGFVPKVNMIFPKNISKKKNISFDKDREFFKIDKLSNFIKSYKDMSKEQKLKMVYTTIYLYSLSTEQKTKNAYYMGRGIKDISLVENIGFLKYVDVKALEELLNRYFPIEDLIEFKIYGKKKQGWNYAYNVAVIPCFDLYSNFVIAFSLRSIDNSYNGVKELNVSCSNIILPTPFGFENKAFKECEKVVIVEGHIDCLSARYYYTEDSKVLFVSFGGIFNYKDEMLGLFKDKKVLICFDKDEAGLRGEEALAKKLSLLGIKNHTLTWDIVDGKDLNDLLNAKKMHTIKLSA